MFSIAKATINIGLPAQFFVLHVTDNHFSLCDERDDAHKQNVAAWKSGKSAKLVVSHEEEAAYAEKHCDLLLRSGDFVDFISKANVDFARRLLKKTSSTSPEAMIIPSM